MSRISRTRSGAAGIEAPAASVRLPSEPLGNAAAAAKNRHSDLRQHPQQAKSQQQLPVVSADNAEQHSTNMLQADLTHQDSLDENVLVAQSGTLKAPDGKIPPADAHTHLPSDSRAARTRSLPPKPSSGRTRSAKAPLAKTSHNPSSPAEHALPDAPAAPAANSLSSTLAGIAQSLVAFSTNLHTMPADPAESLPEQIDMDCDFTNDSEDSDFQPEMESPQAEDDIIDLSQEDPLDVVEHTDGSIAIRSPLQAAAVAVVETAAASAAEAGGGDDEEEFQQLQGKGKRKQQPAAKGVMGGRLYPSLPCLLEAPSEHLLHMQCSLSYVYSFLLRLGVKTDFCVWSLQKQVVKYRFVPLAVHHPLSRSGCVPCFNSACCQ